MDEGVKHELVKLVEFFELELSRYVFVLVNSVNNILYILYSRVVLRVSIVNASRRGKLG